MPDAPIHIVCPQCGSTNRIASGKDPSEARCGKCRTELFSGKSWPATAATFDKHVTRNDIPVVVDFWADWCGPCKGMAPGYEMAAREMEPSFRFLKLDTEAEPQIAARYQIQAIPTLMVFKGGKLVARRAGAIDRRTLESWVRAETATA